MVDGTVFVLSNTVVAARLIVGIPAMEGRSALIVGISPAPPLVIVIAFCAIPVDVCPTNGITPSVPIAGVLTRVVVERVKFGVVETWSVHGPVSVVLLF